MKKIKTEKGNVNDTLVNYMGNQEVKLTKNTNF